MLNKIYIVDFEDSFTFNIASTLYSYCEDIKVISHKDFFKKEFINKLQCDKYPRAIILGPGPGHPNECQGYFEDIKDLRENKNIYLMGICLGHQILGLIDGLVVAEALVLAHGQSSTISFNNQPYLVQRYNSLAVFNTQARIQEINIRYFKNGISYQFHPESVGTQRNIDFFKELIDFILR